MAATGRSSGRLSPDATSSLYRSRSSSTATATPRRANRWAERSGVRLLYVGADLGGDAAPILAAAQARKIPTVTLSRAQFQAGGTLGIVVKDGKPHILVNLPAARTAGMDLDPKLLQLSEVVR